MSAAALTTLAGWCALTGGVLLLIADLAVHLTRSLP